MLYQDTSCCGVREADGLNRHGTPRQAMKDFILDYVDGDGKCAHIVFTEARKTKRSTDTLSRSWWASLERYIKKHGLGQVTSGPWKINPNSRNSVRAHIVTPNIAALKKLFAKEVAKREKENKEKIDYWTRW